MKRSRGRGRRQQNPVNRSYDSNGPDVRVRGTASQVYEKYQTLARDAMLTGDRVNAENLQQHAEHYFRIMQTLQPSPNENKSGDTENGEDNYEGHEANEANGTNGVATPASEPLVLNRNDGDTTSDDAQGESKTKSRRRGPLRRRRSDGEQVDGNVVEAEAETSVADVSKDAPKDTAMVDADTLPAVND
jgi:hypothetical protein